MTVTDELKILDARLKQIKLSMIWVERQLK